MSVRKLARLLDHASPGKAVICLVRRSPADKCDVFTFAEREHDFRETILRPRQNVLRVRCIRHLEHAHIHSLGMPGDLVESRLLSGRQGDRILVVGLQIMSAPAPVCADAGVKSA